MTPTRATTFAAIVLLAFTLPAAAQAQNGGDQGGQTPQQPDIPQLPEIPQTPETPQSPQAPTIPETSAGTQLSGPAFENASIGAVRARRPGLNVGEAIARFQDRVGDLRARGPREIPDRPEDRDFLDIFLPDAINTLFGQLNTLITALRGFFLLDDLSGLFGGTGGGLSLQDLLNQLTRENPAATAIPAPAPPEKVSAPSPVARTAPAPGTIAIVGPPLPPSPPPAPTP